MTPSSSATALLPEPVEQLERKEAESRPQERRSSRRVSLQWVVYVAHDGCAHPVRSKTANLSRDGFYCTLGEPLRPGQQVGCDLIVPAYRPQAPEEALVLRCQARVARVETIKGGQEFGMGFRIEDYCLFHETE